MRKTALALVAATGFAFAGVAAPVAVASGSLHLSVKPAKPSAGQTIKMHATGGVKKGRYVCITALAHKGVKETASLSNETNVVTNAKSNKKGVVNCHLSFLPFTKTVHGKKISCPPTKKNKRDGWGCGAAVANFNNHNQFVLKRFKF
jgi:hypothetical protein